MATVKKFNTTYTIDGPTVYITGNLVTLGNTTAVETENTTIKDNLIVLNDGEAGAGVAGGSGFSGVLVDRGTLSNVALLYYEPFQKWILSNSDAGNVSTFVNIATTTGATALSTVYDDKTPALGGNLLTSSYKIYSNTNVVFGGNLQVTNTTTAPNAVSGSTVFYASTPAGGTAGLYVVNSQATNEELVTKRRAFGFSLLL
jgi:hypothetical protein